MAMHPTFSHAAADLRRQSLLAEADAARHAQPEQERLRIRPRRFALHQWLERVDGIVSRIVDDFEGQVGLPHKAPHRYSARLPSARNAR